MAEGTSDLGYSSLMSATIFAVIAITVAAMMTVVTVAITLAVMTTRLPVVIVVIAICIVIIVTAAHRLIITIAAISATNADTDPAMTATVMSIARRRGRGHHCCDGSGYNEHEFHFHSTAHFIKTPKMGGS